MDQNKKILTVSARINANTLTQLNNICLSLDRSISWLLNKIIIDYLAQQKNKD